MDSPSDLTFNRGLIERARADEAPFAGSEALEAWVSRGLEELA